MKDFFKYTFSLIGFLHIKIGFVYYNFTMHDFCSKRTAGGESQLGSSASSYKTNKRLYEFRGY